MGSRFLLDSSLRRPNGQQHQSCHQHSGGKAPSAGGADDKWLQERQVHRKKRPCNGHGKDGNGRQAGHLVVRIESEHPGNGDQGVSGQSQDSNGQDTEKARIFAVLDCLSLTQFSKGEKETRKRYNPSRHQLDGGNDLVKKIFRDCTRLVRLRRIQISTDQVRTPVE
jgi:hypothetical protein